MKRQHLAWLAAACAWAAFMPVGAKYLAYLGCGAAACVSLWRARQLATLWQQPDWHAAAAFWGLTVLSVAWSSGRTGDIGAQLWLYGMLLVTPVIALGCPVDLARLALRHFGLASAAVGLATVLGHHGMLPESLLWHSTVQAEGNQRIATSLVLALGVAMNLACALQARATQPQAPWQTLGWWVAALLALAGLALQDRRTGMVALPVLLAVLGLARLRTAKARLALVLGVVLLSLAAWQLSPTVRGRIDEGLNEIRRYQPSDSTETSWGMRLRLAEHTLDMVRERPLLGHGVGAWVGQWRQRVQKGLLISIHLTPHNEYLLVASQLGLVGIAALLWLLGGQLVRAWRAGPAAYPALVVWTAIALTGFFNVVIRDAKFALPMLIVAGFAGAACRPGHPPAARG
ncbi:MAG: O-antigen ligase family protein [Burkholderiales bacterium]|nr:O-antigen ligase family protein [Burkholderiales bacterium]